MTEVKGATGFEEHLLFKEGAHLELWHRFKVPILVERGAGSAVVLRTRCGKKINDHWNVKSEYSRFYNHCGECFPNGVTEDGKAKSGERGNQTSPHVVRDASSTTGQQADTGSSGELTSTAEPLISETSDAGDGGAASEEGSGVLGSGDDGHVEELPEVRGARDSAVEGSPDKEAGQGKPVHEPSKGSGQRSTGGRKPQGHTDR